MALLDSRADYERTVPFAVRSFVAAKRPARKREPLSIRQARMDRIAEKQVDLFFRFSGDPDGLARLGTSEEKAAMPSATWFAIVELAQWIAQSKAGLLDAKGEKVLANVLRERCDRNCAQKLMALA